jgi:hypothetical protein
MKFDDRARSRAHDLATPLARLKELAPRLLAILPDTIGSWAERLGATRQEIQDTHQFAIDDVCYREGRLLARVGEGATHPPRYHGGTGTRWIDCTVRRPAWSQMKVTLEPFPTGMNRWGFPKRRESASSCLLAKEVSMYGQGAFG